MEPKHVLEAFLSAVGTGPVLVVANMADPSHANTNDPITEFSPLLRAAVTAANLGAREFTFDIHRPDIVAAVYMFMKYDTEAHAAIARCGVPALGLHYCELNSWMSVCEVSQAGQHVNVRVDAEMNDAFSARTIDIVDFAVVDFDNAEHRAALGEAAVYFESMGWAAAGRVFEALANPPEKKPVRPRPWGPRQSVTIAEAQAQADAREAEFAEELRANGEFEGYRERCAANKAERLAEAAADEPPPVAAS